MVKLSHDNPAKNKWREAWFRFLRKNKNYLKGNPKEWQVAFLPGTEALEIEVYERLGIPRENLIGLENDEQRYLKLKKKGLGIRLTDEPVGALDFFERTSDVFNIINLDYEGTFNPEVLKTIKYLAGRQLLREESLFGLTVLAQREQKESKRVYEAGVRGAIASNNLLDYVDTLNKDYSPQGNRVLFGKNEEFGDTLDSIVFNKDIREQGLTENLISIFSLGKQNLELSPVFRRNPEFQKIENMIKEKLSEKFVLETDFYIRSDVMACLMTDLMIHLANSGFGPMGGNQFIAHGAFLYYSNSYFPRNITRYKYTSLKASPMISDFMRLSQENSELQPFRYFAEHAYIDLNVHDRSFQIWGDYTPSEKEFKGYLNKVYTKFFRWLNKTHSYGERINLGSSAKLPKLEGSDYYKQRYEDEEKGVPIEETWGLLSETFKVTKSQLPRFEAHYTMGTYGPKPSLEEVVDENAEKKLVPDKIDLFPDRYWNRLSSNQQKRIEFFLEDLFRVGLDNAGINRLTNELKKSKVSKLLAGNNLSDSQFYALFDDIFLELNNGGNLSSEGILDLYKNIRKLDWKHNTIKTKQSKKSISKTVEYFKSEKPILTYEIYERLKLEEGKDDKWISVNYKPEKKNSIRAFKAWVTRKQGKKENESEKDLGYQVMEMIENRKSKSQIIDELGLSKMELAGYIASRKRGDYNDVIAKLRKGGQHVVDTRGVVHSSSRKAMETEKGYK